MNELNQWETHLRSWTPRRPSAAVKRRIAAAALAGVAADRAGVAAPSVAAALQVPGFRLAWLAPAAMAMLLVCVLFNQHNTAFLTGSGDSGALVAAALSNQSAAPWIPGSYEGAQNRLPAKSFEWTNGAGSTSATPSLSGSRPAE